MPSDAAPGAGAMLEAMLRRSLLAVLLALPCLAGFATSYLLLVGFLLALALLAGRRTGLRFDAAAASFLAAFVALAVLFALSAEHPSDLLFVFNFSAFLVYAPLATLFGRAADPGNAERVARLALAGTALGLLVSLLAVYGWGEDRGRTALTDTIRLGNTALLLGVLSLVGLRVRADAWRYFYLAGPLLAAAVLLLTGARGGMLAFPMLAAAAALLLVRNRWLALGVVAALAAAVAAAAVTDLFGSARLQSILAIFGDLFSGRPVGDESVRIRIELYKAGWQAFLQSPLVGHGWADLMASVEPFLAAADKRHAGLPHLHNDLITFAVAAGLPGVAVYLALLAVPLVLALRSPHDSQYRARLFGVAMLVLGYAAMGVADTMLSFELHTALYVGLLAVLLAYCRDPRPAA